MVRDIRRSETRLEFGKGPELARPSALRASRGEPDEWDDECFATAPPESAAGIRNGPLVTDPEKPPLSLLCGACQLRQLLLEQSSQHHAFTDAARKLDTYPRPITDVSGRRVGLPS